jgi:GTPase SAR1 family protein
MIEAQKKVVDYCGRLAEALKPANLSEAVTGNLTPLAEEARERELVVPVIGAFSAGKSSLINTLLKSEVLPVAITPETSLAAELHYSPEEYIEAVKPSGETVRYAVSEMRKLSDEAARYSYARLFLRNSRLQELEPLTLVDMPGFDSPLDAHTKAIMAYLDRGCHYIVLSSVEEGTLTKSLIRRLREIDEFGRGFNLFLTKANLRPRDTVDELVRHYGEILRDTFDNDAPVLPLDNKSAEDVVKLLKEIDVNALFFGMYRERLLDICDGSIDALNIKIKALTKDAGKIADATNEMRQSIEKLKKKAADDTDSMQRRYSGGMTGEVVNDVGRTLESSLDELVSVASTGRQDELTRRLNEIVQSAVTVSVKARIGEVNRQIVMDFSESLRGLDKVMKDLDLNGDFLNGMTEKVNSLLMNIPPLDLHNSPSSSPNPIANVMKNPAVGGLSRIGGLGLMVINPVIGIIVALLPDVLGLLFGGGNKQQNQQEALRAKFVGEIIPSVKSKIRGELPSLLEEQIGAMIEQVQNQYAERIAAQETEMSGAIEAKRAGIETAEEQRKQLEAVRAEAQAITGEIMEWGK